MCLYGTEKRKQSMNLFNDDQEIISAEWYRSKDVLDLVHFYVCDPIILSFYGWLFKIRIHILDDVSQMRKCLSNFVLTFVRNGKETQYHFKHLLNDIQKLKKSFLMQNFTCTRPNLAHIISILSIFMVYRQEEHGEA